MSHASDHTSVKVSAPPNGDSSTHVAHPSEEKTEVAVPGSSSKPGSASKSRRTDAVADLEYLKIQLEKKERECEAAEHTLLELRSELNATRKDYSARNADGQLEMDTMHSLLEKSRDELERLKKEIDYQKRSNKALKSQNLRLQYQLNLWGIPVCAGEEIKVPDGETHEGRLFFPKLSALVEGLDPIPVVLRGDIYTFGFPNLLSFLANSNLTGVLTTVSDGVVTKLYIERGILRLCGWNHEDMELSLSTLLAESKLVSSSILEQRREPLYDLELAIILLQEDGVSESLIQSGLCEHARVILAYLFHMDRGAFFFQSGILRRQRYLQFDLPIMDLLLSTAAEVDEKTRIGLVGSGEEENEEENEDDAE